MSPASGEPSSTIRISTTSPAGTRLVIRASCALLNTSRSPSSLGLASNSCRQVPMSVSVSHVRTVPQPAPAGGEQAAAVAQARPVAPRPRVGRSLPPR